MAEYIIRVPPLRERSEDVPFLAPKFLTQAREVLNRPAADIDSDGLDFVIINGLETFESCARGCAARADDLVSSLRSKANTHVSLACNQGAPLRQRVKDQVHALERDAIAAALKDAMGKQGQGSSCSLDTFQAICLDGLTQSQHSLGQQG